MKKIDFKDLEVIKNACGEVMNMNAHVLSEANENLMQQKISKEEFNTLKINCQAQMSQADSLYKKANDAIIEKAMEIFNKHK